MTRQQLEALLEDDEFRASEIERCMEDGTSRAEAEELLEDEDYRESLRVMYTDIELDLEDRENDWT